MKVFLTLGVFFAIISMASVSALISSDIKGEYSQGETIIAKIENKILEPITKKQINLKREGHIDLPFDYDVRRLNGSHYLWFIVPQRNGEYNCTLFIEDVFVEESGIRMKKTLQQDFFVENNKTDYSIMPGLVFTNEDFEIELNLFDSNVGEVTTNFPAERSISVSLGKNKIAYSISETEGTKFFNIGLGRYNVPAFIIGETIKEQECLSNEDCGENEICADKECVYNETPEELENVTFRIFPEVMRATLLEGKVNSLPFEIINYGNKDLREIEFEYDTDLFLIEYDPNIAIESGKKADFDIIFLENREKISSTIKITSKNFSEVIVIDVNFSKNDEEVNIDYGELDEDIIDLNCVEIEGKICSAGELCEGDAIKTRDANGALACCLGSCKEKKEGNNPIWGYIIIVLLVVLVIFIILRYRKTGSAKNPMKKYI